MSILSTNQRLVSVGNYYSAGENIGIYDNTISSRNWTPDITYASESAYSRSTAWVSEQGYITGGDLSNYYQKNETSSKQEISAAIAAIPLGDEEVNQVVHTNSSNWNDITVYQSNSANYLTSIPSDLDLNNISANNVVFKTITETIQGEVSTAFTTNLTDYGWAIATNFTTNNVGYSSDNMKISADLPITGTGYFDVGVHQEYNEHFGSWRVPYDQIGLMNTLQVNEYSAHFQTLANSLTGNDNISTIIIFDDRKNTLSTGEANFVVSYPGLETQPLTFSSFYTNYGNTSAMLSGAIDYVSAHAGGVTGEFVPLSSFNELKQSYDALSSLFATYSGQWL